MRLTPSPNEKLAMAKAPTPSGSKGLWSMVCGTRGHSAGIPDLLPPPGLAFLPASQWSQL